MVVGLQQPGEKKMKRRSILKSIVALLFGNKLLASSEQIPILPKTEPVETEKFTINAVFPVGINVIVSEDKSEYDKFMEKHKIYYNDFFDKSYQLAVNNHVSETYEWWATNKENRNYEESKNSFKELYSYVTYLSDYCVKHGMTVFINLPETPYTTHLMYYANSISKLSKVDNDYVLKFRKHRFLNAETVNFKDYDQFTETFTRIF
jgi:hypothetical protein